MAGWLHSDLRPDVRRAPGMRSLAADAALAALFVWITVVSLRSDAYVNEYGPVEGLGLLLALSPNLLLLTRRMAPAATLAVATVLYLAASATQGDSNAPLAVPFFAYSVGLTRPVRVSGPIVATAALALSTSTFYGPGDPDPLAIMVWFMLFGIGWLVAVSIRRNQNRAEQLSQEVSDLEAGQAEIAAAAIAEERTRIARELHDAVGHAVNVMVLQAGAARLSGRPEKAFEALHEIEALGRSALTDLDQLLGLLTDADDPVRSPARELCALPSLVQELRTAGADITLHDHCPQEDLDRHVGAAAYRIAQEALTNAIKHAGVAHVEVTVTCGDRDVRLRVADDGLGAHAARSPHGGRGIVGMAERAKLLGGRLSAAPGADGGFVVEAVLPRRPEHPRPASAARHPESATR